MAGWMDGSFDPHAYLTERRKGALRTQSESQSIGHRLRTPGRKEAQIRLTDRRTNQQKNEKTNKGSVDRRKKE